MLARVVVILLILAGANAAALFAFPRAFYRYVVIHHSASPSGTYESIRSFHEREHGWSDAGYHLVLSNGASGIPRGHLEATDRYRGAAYALATQSSRHNVFGLHVCIIGDYSRNEVPEDLKAAAGNCVRELQRRFWIADDHVLFHRDIGATECPGTRITHEDVLRWRDSAEFPLADSVRDQQARALGTFTLGLTDGVRIRHLILGGMNIGLLGCLGLVMGLPWRARRRRVGPWRNT